MTENVPFDAGNARLDFARQVLEMESKAIADLRLLVGAPFQQALDLILNCEGRVVVSGMGKAGLIGRKLSATLASTGTPSFSLHPAEALHGDLGRVRKEDVIILISNSGESREVLALIDPLKRIGCPLIAMTGRPESPLGANCEVVLDCGRAPEACPLGLAPTTSTAALLALGDALAMTLLNERGFAREDYARYHPGGALGRSLMKVGEIMRQGKHVTLVGIQDLARDVVIAMNATPGRPGAAMVVDAEGRLAGFFTDGDLARHLQQGLVFLQRPICEVMATDPITISPQKLASASFALLRGRRVDQLPVVDEEGRPVGLIDVQDLLDARIV